MMLVFNEYPPTNTPAYVGLTVISGKIYKEMATLVVSEQGNSISEGPG